MLLLSTSCLEPELTHRGLEGRSGVAKLKLAKPNRTTTTYALVRRFRKKEESIANMGVPGKQFDDAGNMCEILLIIKASSLSPSSTPNGITIVAYVQAPFPAPLEGLFYILWRS